MPWAKTNRTKNPDKPHITRLSLFLLNFAEYELYKPCRVLRDPMQYTKIPNPTYAGLYLKIQSIPINHLLWFDKERELFKFCCACVYTVSELCRYSINGIKQTLSPFVIILHAHSKHGLTKPWEMKRLPQLSKVICFQHKQTHFLFIWCIIAFFVFDVNTFHLF